MEEGRLEQELDARVALGIDEDPVIFFSYVQTFLAGNYSRFKACCVLVYVSKKVFQMLGLNRSNNYLFSSLN